MCVCVSRLFAFRCSLFVVACRLCPCVLVWLVRWLVVVLLLCVVVVPVTMGASTRVFPDVDRLKLSLLNRQTDIYIYIYIHIAHVQLHIFKKRRGRGRGREGEERG